MILDRLENAERYVRLNPAFAPAFRFLQRADLGQLAAGRHEVDGDRIYAVVARDKGRRRAEAKLEAHRKYIDIQFVVAGNEEMGWTPLASCGAVSVPYNPQKDIEFFGGDPDVWLPVGPGAFAVFFPDDAHAPLVGTGTIHKVIVKVAVSAPTP
jgi:YhcH/YjgK/YiaL family protein